MARKKNGDRDERNAKIFYVDLNLTAKEIAERLGYTEKTIGDWIKKGKWKSERDARNASPIKRINNVKEIISNLSEEWLELNRQVKDLESRKADPEEIADLRSRIRGIDDAVSKWNKTLEGIEKESKVPLTTYLQVMEDVFSDMRAFNKELFLETVDFQTYHIDKVALKLG